MTLRYFLEIEDDIRRRGTLIVMKARDEEGRQVYMGQPMLIAECDVEMLSPRGREEYVYVHIVELLTSFHRFLECLGVRP